MGFFSALFDFLTGASNTVRNNYERQSSDYSSGYSYGSERASGMTDSELRSELRRAKENGVSDMKNAGKTKAMIDEYNDRQSKKIDKGESIWDFSQVTQNLLVK